jgi:hypothetical protein
MAVDIKKALIEASVGGLRKRILNDDAYSIPNYDEAPVNMDTGLKEYVKKEEETAATDGGGNTAGTQGSDATTQGASSTTSTTADASTAGAGGATGGTAKETKPYEFTFGNQTPAPKKESNETTYVSGVMKQEEKTTKKSTTNPGGVEHGTVAFTFEWKRDKFVTPINIPLYYIDPGEQRGPSTCYGIKVNGVIDGSNEPGDFEHYQYGLEGSNKMAHESLVFNLSYILKKNKKGEYDTAPEDTKIEAASVAEILAYYNE